MYTVTDRIMEMNKVRLVQLAKKVRSVLTRSVLTYEIDQDRSRSKIIKKNKDKTNVHKSL